MSQLKIYDLAAGIWRYVSSPSQMVSVSDSAPPTPNNGDLWWDTDDASLLVDTVAPSTLANDSAFTTKYAPQWIHKDWSIANGYATNLAQAIGSQAGGTNWGSTPIAIGRVSVSDKICKAKIRITAGGTGIVAGSAGNMRINLPLNARFSAGSEFTIGGGWWMIGNTSIFARVEINIISATQADMYYPATHLGTITVVTPTTPFTLASGSVTSLWLDYELA
jgi:hypothetical protein